jgi:hypothetical protein
MSLLLLETDGKIGKPRMLAVIVRSGGVARKHEPLDASGRVVESNSAIMRGRVIVRHLEENLRICSRVQNPWAKPTGTKSWR